jgi:putative ABC transport system permease protein
MNFLRENISIALDSIKANKLRAIITMLIISIGITALVGILSAIDAIKNGINSNFKSMGANTFTIRESDKKIKVGRRGKKSQPAERITFDEALRFSENFKYPVTTSIFAEASYNSTVRFENKKSNPNITVYGADENYLVTAAYELEKGRNFTQAEVSGAPHVTIIGKEIERTLFGKRPAIDKFIKIGAQRFKVIGVLQSKGASAESGNDKLCIIPLRTARQYYGANELFFTINVLCLQTQVLDVMVHEARGLFRKIRKIPLSGREDFDVVKSDNLASMVLKDISMVTTGATVIGLITLLGAAIGLMNIMLVSVTERTREIGIRKAMGATAVIIKNQFLIESVVICLMGGFVGILLGIIIGNVISLGLDTGFFIPWFWITGGVVICIIVGLLSGYLPAKRASQLDPIESLRFE